MAGREPVLLRDVLDADLASLADLPMQVCEFEHITRFDPVALELLGRLPWQDTEVDQVLPVNAGEALSSPLKTFLIWMRKRL